jgi:hypothetical protein
VLLAGREGAQSREQQALVVPGALLHGDELGASHQRRVGQLGEPVAQHTLEVGLVEHVGRGEAVHADRVAAPELRHRALLGVDEPQAQCGHRDVGESLNDAEVGEHAVDLVVEVHGPGERVDVVPPVDDQRPHPVLGQQDGGADADGPGADHEDRDDRAVDGKPRHGATTTLCWVPRSMAPSAVRIVAVRREPGRR